jgi:hypothetical protein
LRKEHSIFCKAAGYFQVASEAVDKVRTLASLTKEFYFLEKYMGYFDAMKK